MGVKTLFIEPGSPWENGYNERFNGSLGDEVLKREVFYTLEEAKIIIEMWRNEYNQIRPQSSLGYRSPVTETVATWMVPARGADPSGLTHEVVQ